MAFFLKSIASSGPPMCENCGLQPKFGGFDYCGRSCAAEAERKKKAKPRSAVPPRLAHLVAEPSSSSGLNSTVASESGLCENCGLQPKFGAFEYCGKTCASEAEKRKASAAHMTNASGPPNSSALQNFLRYSTSAGPNATDTSNMCENCSVRPKSQERDDGGRMITHPYCGINCYKASQRSIFPAATIPAPAAASSNSDPVKLCKERITTPVGRKILLMMQERWKSDELSTPQIKAIHRIDLSAQVYRRFDLALQMNDKCPVTTTYYGGVAACNIASDKDPAPCGSESCEVCDVLRSSFGNLLYGDGVYGHGLYTYTNPALAHNVVVSGDDEQTQDSSYVLVQCRVITQADSRSSSDPYSGFIDDSGVAFCAQPLAIIPTHLLTYRATPSPKPHHTSTSINANQDASAATTGANDSGESNEPTAEAGGAQPKPTQGKGKGKARATDTLQKAQRSIPGGSSAADAEASAVPPPSREGDRATRGSTMPQALYQTNLASPGPGSFYVQTPAGYVPVQHPAPGIALDVMGPDGNYYPAQPAATAPIMYPTISSLTQTTAAAQGLMSTPAADPAAASLRALINPNMNPDTRGSPPTVRSPPPQATPAADPAAALLRALINPYPNPDTRGSPPTVRSPPPQTRVDDDDTFDYLNYKDPKGAPARTHSRPASISYDRNRATQQKATRQSSYPAAKHLGNYPDEDNDEDLRSSAAVAQKYVKRTRDLTPPMDEADDYFDY